MRALRLGLVLAVTMTVTVTAAPRAGVAQPWRDLDVVVDRDPTVGCRAEHAAPGAVRHCLRYVRAAGGDLVLLAPLVFEIERATLRPISFPILDEVVAYLGAHPRVRIEIAAQQRPAPERAMRLADRRAKVIQAYLIDRGVAAARLVARGYDAPTSDLRTELHILP